MNLFLLMPGTRLMLLVTNCHFLLVFWANNDHLPSGGGVCRPPVGAASQPSQVAWKPPSAPATHTEGNSFIFGVATGTVARSLRLQFTSGWVGHVAPWSGINKQRAVCPDSRSPKVNQSNSVSVDWQAGDTAAWPVSWVLTCKWCMIDAMRDMKS